MAATLSSLPPHAFIQVLEFALYDFTQDFGPNERKLPLKSLKTISLVSKSTHQLVQSIIQHFQDEMGYIEWEDNGMIDDEGVVEIIDEMKDYGMRLKDFRLRLGYYDDRKLSPSPGLGELEDLHIDWDKLFGFMPGLKRLDLTQVPLLSHHLPNMLQAASKQCRHLEFLILPRKSDYNSTLEGPEIDNLMEALYKALEMWYTEGKCGGLRQLTVPARTEVDIYRTSTQYIEAVIRFCPNIEYLDGYERTRPFSASNCVETWPVSLETWMAFNTICTNLRAFSWTVVPFADDFFRVFGEHVKPQLKSLCLSPNRDWRGYMHYFREYHGTEQLDPWNGIPHFAENANDTHLVFRGCPNLTDLYIEINHFINEGRTHDWYVNANVFGDEFWDAVATHCPLIESIMMFDSSNHHDFNIRPIEAMTDRTLLSLASLKKLSECDIGPARVTGNGICEFIQRVSTLEKAGRKERMFCISVGGHRGRIRANFYLIILELLRKLSEINEEDLGAASSAVKTELHVINPYTWRVDGSWCESYMREELHPLLATVKAKHPSLALEVDIVGRNENKFDRIDRLILDWRPRYHGRSLFYDMRDSDDAADNMGSEISLHSWESDDNMSEDTEDEDEVMNDD